jgi:hypothetical protein
LAAGSRRLIGAGPPERADDSVIRLPFLSVGLFAFVKAK